jgi:Xaa-Pro aminopeptidase
MNREKAETPMHPNRRVQQLRNLLASLKLDAYLVTFPPHLRYLSGFSGSNGAGIITSQKAALITDGRYEQQVKGETGGWKVHITPDGLVEEIDRHHHLKAGMRVGFDGNTVPYGQFRDWKKRFPRVKFLPKADVVEQIAVVKDQQEISSIRSAVAISDRVFTEILPLLKPGVAELDIAAEISYRHKKHGAEGDAFESIVASGIRSALPHGKASIKKLRRGDAVTLDFGCTVSGYHSDITRTVVIGRCSREIRKIYGIVLEAQLRAIDYAQAGIKSRDLDAVARFVISQSGFGHYFRHSLGHGIGLQIHEQPRVSVLSTSILKAGNVLTIEPGIYIPGIGGVRIEDDVVITATGCEVLNRAPKDLLIL